MRWIRGRLARRLFLSYLFVILAGVITVIVVASAIGPTFFTASMSQMMRTHGPAGMTGRLPPGIASLDAAFRAALARSLVVGALVGVLVALPLSFMVARQVTRPVQRVAGAARRIASGHYAERVPIEPDTESDEVQQLAASFNAMAAALEQTERRRLELIGDVAHELRTPIATLQGYLEGLLDGVVEPSPCTWGRLHDEAGRLHRLVDDLQELSRAEARQIPLTIRPVAVSTIIQPALDRLAPEFAEKGLTLSYRLSPHLPPIVVDPDRAVQVVTNLLSNALRYTPAPGEVILTATRCADTIAITVRDTGIGLAPNDRGRIFERFHRVERSRSRAGGGTGVGLTITRALVEAMGGRITAESPGPGQGATFAVTFPIACSALERSIS